MHLLNLEFITHPKGNIGSENGYKAFEKVRKGKDIRYPLSTVSTQTDCERLGTYEKSGKVKNIIP